MQKDNCAACVEGGYTCREHRDTEGVVHQRSGRFVRKLTDDVMFLCPQCGNDWQPALTSPDNDDNLPCKHQLDWIDPSWRDRLTPQPKAVKYDNDKPRYDLIPPHALDELAKVYAMGANKYSARNWEKGLAYGRLFAAAMRHLFAFWMGEDKDKESGLHHCAHAAFSVLGLVEYSFTGKGEDDRPKS